MAPSVPAVIRTAVSAAQRVAKSSRAVIGIRDFATANESTDGTCLSLLFSNGAAGCVFVCVSS